MAGLDGVLDTLHKLPAEIVSKRGGPVRAALRKGALVIHAQAKANLQAATVNATDSATRLSTGLLEQNLVVSRGKKPLGSNGERFLVRIRRKTYGERKDGDTGKPVTTRKTAQLLEYGSSQQPAEPWLRPAFEAKKQEALDTVQTELHKAIERIVKRLAKQNKGR